MKQKLRCAKRKVEFFVLHCFALILIHPAEFEVKVSMSRYCLPGGMQPRQHSISEEECMKIGVHICL